MGTETYLERPLAETIACATVSAGAAATVAHFGARRLASKSDGQPELSLWATLAVAAAAYATSWLVETAMRKAFVKHPH